MKGNVKIAVEGGKKIPVDAELFGIVAVVKKTNMSEKPVYSITHAKTGFALGPHIAQHSKAVKLASLVNENSKEFTGLSTKKKTTRNSISEQLFKYLWLKVGLSQYW